MSPNQQSVPGAGENGVSDSLVRIELITYFHRNPGLEGTSSDLAEAIGRHLSQVECQMNKLVQLHILEENTHNGQCHYRYIPPRSVAAYLVRKAGK